jgi:hypothetical protein
MLHEVAGQAIVLRPYSAALRPSPLPTVRRSTISQTGCWETVWWSVRGTTMDGAAPLIHMTAATELRSVAVWWPPIGAG